MSTYMVDGKKMKNICILEILRKYTDSEHTMDQKDIIKKLETEYGMKVDRKSVKSNLMNLVDFGYNLECTEIERENKNGEIEILTKDWAQLTEADLVALASCGYRQASCEKLHFDEHEAFSSLCFLEQHLTLQQLQAAADRLFADAACGHVLRVKGFAPDPQGTTGWLELNATAAGKTLAPIPQGQDVLIVIGEGLDKTAIEARLKA